MSNAPCLIDYLHHIGRITIEAATLEEVILVNLMALADEPFDETRSKYMFRGLDMILTELSKLISARVSTHYRQTVLDLIEKARQLKDKRNESVHGVWGEMIEADTKTFVGVSRARYEKDKATKRVSWDLKTPTIEELDKLGADLRDVAHKLQELLKRVWDLDDDVRQWRLSKNL